MAYKKYAPKGGCTIQTLQRKLPQVGSIVKRRMYIGLSHVGKKHDCVVTFVNRDHLWYEVEFPCGVRQAFRII